MISKSYVDNIEESLVEGSLDINTYYKKGFGEEYLLDVMPYGGSSQYSVILYMQIN